MISPEEAWSRIAAHCAPLDVIRLERRNALGRYPSEDLSATTEVPPADVSALDGIAYAGDVPRESELEVVATIAAGDPPGFELPPGKAVRIWTGAPVPGGADRVVGVEDVEEGKNAGRVVVIAPARAGNAIRRRAEILAVGQPLVGPGAALGPAALSLLASQGIHSLHVVRAPTLAILTTGDEVVEPDTTPAPGQLRDSHTDYLLAATRALGIEATALGIAGDDPSGIGDRLAAALERFDVVLVCGGVSLGGRDFTPTAFVDAGARVAFDRVAVQPGKPLVFAHRGRRLLFGLPGNPASVMVSFRLFVRPALDRLAGGGAAFWSDAHAIPLADPLAGSTARDRFVPAHRVVGRDLRAAAQPLGVRGSHDLTVFARADLLLRIRAGDPPRETGSEIEAIAWG